MRVNVVIAGGGVAALEAMLALRALAGERVEMLMLCPAGEFVYSPLSVLGPFEAGAPPRFDLAGIADSQGGEFRHEGLAAVDLDANHATTSSGARYRFDALIVATGTDARVALDGAFTFRGPRDVLAFTRLLDEIEVEQPPHLTFAIPSGATWPLPLYELALMTSGRLASKGAPTAISLVTSEAEPLALFGHDASNAVRRLLAEHSIELHSGKHPAEVVEGEIRLVPDGSVVADRVVALPRLEGRSIEGLPHNQEGFLRVDDHGRVEGASNVYAAGDVTDFAVKQGGIAAQQADAVAEHVAARFGAEIEPAGFRPVLRGLLLSARGPEYLRMQISGGEGDRSEASGAPLWWPATKLATRYLSPFLATRGDLMLRPDGGGLEPGRRLG